VWRGAEICLLDLGVRAQLLTGARQCDAPRLKDIGAVLEVEQRKGTTYLYFKGQIQPAAEQTKNGTNFLYFRP